MGDRTLPPQVEGLPQGRLDVIIGRPTLFPTPKATQSFIFTFRWWGDTNPCVLRLPPDKSESRITYYVTCGSRSFRQYLCDAGSLLVNVKIAGGKNVEPLAEIRDGHSSLPQSPRRGWGGSCETPRHKLLQRQLRVKKGWQDGDIVGSFVLPDLKLNSRGDCVHECQITDSSSSEIIGSIVVTMVFLEGSLEDFQQIKLSSEDEATIPEQTEEVNTKSKTRVSGIPVRDAQVSKNSQGSQRSRTGSFRSLPRPVEKLKSPPKKSPPDLQNLENQGKEKENQASHKKADTFSHQISKSYSPRVVRRERKSMDSSLTRERPASWGLYPILNGTDPNSLVESGAVKAADLPVLLEVLEGRSPNLNFSNLDPETQQLLEGLDLSLSLSGISTTSSERKYANIPKSRSGTQGTKSHMISMLKSNQKDGEDSSTASMPSGVWPLAKEEDPKGEKIKNLTHPLTKDKSHLLDSPKLGSPRRLSHDGSARTKIPTCHTNTKPPLKSPSISHATSKDQYILPPPRVPAEDPKYDKSHVSSQKAVSKHVTEVFLFHECSVLTLDLGTLTLSPPLLPPKPQNNVEKISGVRVLHRSRVCYLTTLSIILPGLEIPQDWEMSQTCASRQLVDHEIHYNVREIMKLPPASSLDIFKGQLLIRCVCRRLGERDSEEVGSSSVSLMDIWQLNGSELQVPLFKVGTLDNQGSPSSRRRGKHFRNEAGTKRIPLAHITFTSKLCLGQSQVTPQEDSSSRSGGLHSQQEVKSSSHSRSSIELANGDLPKSPVLMRGTFYSVKSSRRGLSNGTCAPSSSSDEDSRGSHSYPLKPRTGIQGSHEHAGPSSAYRSIYSPSHISPQEKAYRNTSQYPVSKGRIEKAENFLHPPADIKPVTTKDIVLPSNQSRIVGINGFEIPSSQPLENGGESPCIRTLSDFQADFLSPAALNRKSVMESQLEEQSSSCKVHLEIIKGRNLAWLPEASGGSRPPNSYVRSTIGSYSIQTNVCLESDNPMWSFSADVFLPYSQLCQTDGKLILKVYHSPADSWPSPDDPILGFVCVDATSIWSGHVSLCGWYPLLDLRGCVRGHIKVSLTPHEPPQAFGSPKPRHSASFQDISQHISPRSYPSYGGFGEHLYTKPQSNYNTEVDKRFSSNVLLQPRYVSSGPQSSLSPQSHDDGYGSSQFRNLEQTVRSSENHEASLYSNISSVISSGSVVVDARAINDFSSSDSGSSPRSKPSLHNGLMSPCSKNERMDKSERQDKSQIPKKTSNIPVFLSSKETTRSTCTISDTRNTDIVLPQVSYRQRANTLPCTTVYSQGYCRHKGAVIVRGASADSDTMAKTSPGTNTFDKRSEVPTKRITEKDDIKGPLFARDSVIDYHFKIQNEKDSKIEKCIENTAFKADTFRCKDITGDKMLGTNTDNRCDSPMSVISSSLASDIKPSSCLKVPGSPSLRAKHVTFAHKLVEHQGSETKTSGHSQYNTLYRKPSSLPQTSLRGSNVYSNYECKKQQTDSPRKLGSFQSKSIEESDLQVVPCREGDKQVVTTTVSVPGSRTLNTVSSFGGDIQPGLHTHQKDDRTDLIMAFSWMNLNSGDDTPCVSYIESSQQLMSENRESMNNGDITGSTPQDHSKEIVKTAVIKGPHKEVRKFSNRLAANFPIK